MTVKSLLRLKLATQHGIILLMQAKELCIYSPCWLYILCAVIMQYLFVNRYGVFCGRLPLTLEWSPCAPSNLLLAGCHDGTVSQTSYFPPILLNLFHSRNSITISVELHVYRTERYAFHMPRDLDGICKAVPSQSKQLRLVTAPGSQYVPSVSAVIVAFRICSAVLVATGDVL